MRVDHVRTDQQFRNFRRSPVIGDIVHQDSGYDEDGISEYTLTCEQALHFVWRTE